MQSVDAEIISYMQLIVYDIYMYMCLYSHHHIYLLIVVDLNSDLLKTSLSSLPYKLIRNRD